MNKNLKPKEEGHIPQRPRENPEGGTNLSGMIDAIRAKIEGLSETSRSFEMLAGILNLLTKAPKRLMPLYLATAIVLLSACSSGELINRERRMSGLSIQESSEMNSDATDNPERQAVKKRLEEILEFLGTASDEKGKNRFHIDESKKGKKRIMIWDKDRKESWEGIDFNEETKEPILWIKNTPEENINSDAIIFKENGAPEFRLTKGPHETATMLYYAAGEPFIREEGIDVNGNIIVKKRRIYKRNGDTFGTIEVEKEKNPKITPAEYLNMLAEELNTYEKLSAFLLALMKYQHDSIDPDNPLQKGSDRYKGEYWQTSLETIARVEHDKMLGDCEDYSFLARDILRKQGKLAHVVNTPGHATCVWLEQDANGKYTAYSLSTEGFAKNDELQKSIKAASKSENKTYKKHATAKAALNAALKKYGNMHIENTIIINEIIDGAEAKFIVPLEAFISEREYMKAIEKTEYFRRRNK